MGVSLLRKSGARMTSLSFQSPVEYVNQGIYLTRPIRTLPRMRVSLLPHWARRHCVNKKANPLWRLALLIWQRGQDGLRGCRRSVGLGAFIPMLRIGAPRLEPASSQLEFCPYKKAPAP